MPTMPQSAPTKTPSSAVFKSVSKKSPSSKQLPSGKSTKLGKSAKQPPPVSKTTRKSDFQPIEDKMEHPLLSRMVERQRAKAESKKFKFTSILYNAERKAFLDRTSGEWGRVCIFYLFYYGVLFGVTVAMFYFVFELLLDENVPVWMGQRSVLGNNPSLRILAPDVRNIKPKGIFIVKYNVSDESSWFPYVQSLRKIICLYQKPKIDNKTLFNCSDSCSYVKKQTNELDASCYYEVTSNNPVTGLGPCFCQGKNCKRHKFGYDKNEDSTPCVAIAINKMYDWVPNEMSALFGDMPEPPDQCIAGGSDKMNCYSGSGSMINFTCEPKTDYDSEHFQKVNVYPEQGISYCYYPFYHQPKYQQPFVMIELIKPKFGVFIQVECHAYAGPTGNIKKDTESKGGLVEVDFWIDKYKTMQQRMSEINENQIFQQNYVGERFYTNPAVNQSQT